jgi:hypothetical protein
MLAGLVSRKMLPQIALVKSSTTMIYESSAFIGASPRPIWREPGGGHECGRQGADLPPF